MSQDIRLRILIGPPPEPRDRASAIPAISDMSRECYVTVTRNPSCILSLFATVWRVSTDRGGSQPHREDEIDRRLRELTEEIDGAARIKEPSAAERARKPGLLNRRRSAAEAGNAYCQAPRTRGNRLPKFLAWAIVAAIFGTTIALSLVHFSPRPPASPRAVNDTRPVTNGPVPTSLAPASSPSQPFAGTPAAGFADGQAGIVLPRARPAGTFSAAQVGAAYREVRKLLIASALNQRTLRGGSPDAFTRLLIAQQRSFFVSRLNNIGVTKHGVSRSTRNWVNSFVPGTTQLIGSIIKVHGAMSAQATHQSGRQVLVIHVDYLFVYPVQPPRAPANWMRIVARNYGSVAFATWDDPGGPLEPFLTRWNDGGTAGARCGIDDGFIHPYFPNGPPDKVRPSGAPVNPYDQSTKPNLHGCTASTGT